MLTKIDFERAKKIVEGLVIPEEFGVNGETDEFDGWYDLDLQVRRCGLHNFRIDNGISKAVIIPTDENFVIKIPFNGITYPVWNEETEEYSDSYFEPFRGAEAPDNTDYCWDELCKIEKAEYAGFFNLFPETAFLEEENGVRFYIQEKVQTASHAERPQVSEDSRNKAKQLDNYYQACGEDWRAAVIEFYGENLR